MNPTEEDTAVSGANLCAAGSAEQLLQQSTKEIASTSVTEEKSVKESLGSTDFEQSEYKMKKSLELVGMTLVIEQMESKQKNLEHRIAKLSAQNESLQNEIRSLNEKLNTAMKVQIDPNDELKRYRDLPIMRMTPKCWSRTEWFRVYEERMATTNKKILKACLMYYLSDEFQNRSFLDYFRKRNYDELKFMFLKSSDF